MATTQQQGCASIGILIGMGSIGAIIYGFATNPVLTGIILGGILLTFIALGISVDLMEPLKLTEDSKGLVAILILSMGVGFIGGFATKPVVTAYIFGGVVAVVIVLVLVWKLAGWCISVSKDPATEPLLPDVEAQRRAAGPVAVEAIGPI